ncbi:MAG: CoA ester lyase [Chloroflexota bacterium]|nr:CoA ester lyase [Chloroflexota bacterium]
MRAERTVLVVPASNQRMIEKAATLRADVVLLDLEDSVTPDAKPEARRRAVASARDLDWGERTLGVRLNGRDTPWFSEDLQVIAGEAGDRIAFVMLPKVNRPEEVSEVDSLLAKIEATSDFRARVGIEAQIETADGVMRCDSIAGASKRLQALVFGPGDFAASVGAPVGAIGTPDGGDSAYPGHRFGYAMQRILVAGRAHGLAVIDGPFADIRDEEGLRSSAMTARVLGYDGKWCIHPGQLAIVLEVFMPDAVEITWARQVVDAANGAAVQGGGAVLLDGKMIDAASVRMAKRTLAREIL